MKNFCLSPERFEKSESIQGGKNEITILESLKNHL